jgi:hypothetical protein
MMKLSALVLLVGLALPGPAVAQPPACFPLRPPRVPLLVDVDAVQVRTEGALVWLMLAYHNPTTTPLHIGLRQWPNACTQLVDDVHTTYTLLQTVGMGYGYDPQPWLTLPPDGRATVVFLFRANDPTGTSPTRYTLLSEQLLRRDEAAPVTAFTVVLRNLLPREVARE